MYRVLLLSDIRVVPEYVGHSPGQFSPEWPEDISPLGIPPLRFDFIPYFDICEEKEKLGLVQQNRNVVNNIKKVLIMNKSI